MTEGEIRFMEGFKIGEMTVQPGTPLLNSGASSPQLFTVMEGFGIRFKLLEDGRRQVLSFVFPGDFIGLQAGVMSELDHCIEATSSMKLCVFNRNDLWSLYKTHPKRAYDLTWITAAEERFLGEALVAIGQKSAIESVAWALSRVFRRLRAVELGTEVSVPFPYRQQDLADALGLSLVHTNKTLAKLRERQIAQWSDGHLTISNVEELERMGLVEDAAPLLRPII